MSEFTFRSRTPYGHVFARPTPNVAELPGSPGAFTPRSSRLFSKQPKRFIAIGIDFGTTFSGVSWAYSEDPDTINEVTSWPSIGHQVADEHQVPTQYDMNNDTWGYLIEKDANPIRWFKLLLLQNEDIKDDVRDSEYLADARVRMSQAGSDGVIVLISKYLRRLWEHTLDEIKVQINAQDLEDLPFKVAITVPAIWPQYARYKMREAAMKAGILDPRDIGETFFMLVEEPEAAAVATLFERRKFPDITDGDSFTVCDCGGGTVDIISYKVQSVEPFKIRENTVGDGKLCGAFVVDDAFEKFMSIKSGLKFKNCNAAEFRMFVSDEWEYTLKRAFTGRETNRNFYIRPPQRAFSRLKRIAGDTDTFTISKSHIAQFYAKSLAGIKSLVSQQVNAVERNEGREPKRILLVGGFGSSRYLYNELNDMYGNVLQPSRPWSAVARGAVIKLLRHTMTSEEFRNEFKFSACLNQLPEISSRISKLSYGVEAGMPIQRIQPPVDKRLDRVTTNPDGRTVVWRMRWYLKHGETVDNKDPVSMDFYEYVKDASTTQTNFRILTCAEAEPPVRKDQTVKHMCDIKCEYGTPFEDLPRVGKGSLRRVEDMKLTMKFEGEPEWAVMVGNNKVKQGVNVTYTT